MKRQPPSPPPRNMGGAFREISFTSV